LIDLAGQHAHQGLVDAGRHRAIVDAILARAAQTRRGDVIGSDLGARATQTRRGDVIGSDLGAREAGAAVAPEVAAMADAWDRLRAIDDELAGLVGGDGAARIDVLRFQLDELESARLAPGEDDRLDGERIRLAAVDQLEAAARAAEDLLYASDDSAVDRVAAACRELDRVARIDPAIAVHGRALDDARAVIEDVAGSLRAYADHLEGDPERLAWIDDRLAAIKRIARKHGGTVDTAIARLATLRAELDGLGDREARIAALTRSRDAAAIAAETAARALTVARTTAARGLERDAARGLGELGLGGARMTVAIEAAPLGRCGADRVELLLAANKGEDPRPLARIASGGELSRIMLALKLALRRADEVATYVFDEVDAGIGGATAHAVGRLIRAVADHRQVICVTHLPQIAAHADHHFHVEKSEIDGRVETTVREVTGTRRRDALARMLGGNATTRARAHAAELLAGARR
jgi:DNA repair protein RecN (Recombination protein N)